LLLIRGADSPGWITGSSDLRRHPVIAISICWLFSTRVRSISPCRVDE